MSDILDGSVDSASWAADGSHEVEIGGRYYGDDVPRKVTVTLTADLSDLHLKMWQLYERQAPWLHSTQWRPAAFRQLDERLQRDREAVARLSEVVPPHALDDALAACRGVATRTTASFEETVDSLTRIMSAVREHMQEHQTGDDDP